MVNAVEMSSKQKADELIQWLRHYAENFLNLTLADERRCIPPNVFMDFGNKGIFGLNIPKEYGGQGLDKIDYYRVIEQLGAIDISLSTTVCLHTENGMGPILRSTNEYLKKEILPKMAAGRFIGSVGLTEPSFGTNLLDMKTTAVKTHDKWLIKGVKRWNSSNWAHVVNVFAVSKDEKTRERGVTGFTLLKSMPGVINGEEALTMGVRSIMQNALILENVDVGDEYIIGEVHKGFHVIETMLNEARIAFCFGLIGAMKRVVQIVHRFLTVRRGQTGKLIQYPYIVDRLNGIICSIKAIESLAIRSVAYISEGHVLPTIIYLLLKVAASEYAIENTKLCMQLAGGRGYMENNHIARYMKDVLASYYGEGANDALLSIAGNDIFYKTEFTRFIEDNYKTDDLYVEFKKVVEDVKNNAAGKTDKTYLSSICPHLARLGLTFLLYCSSLEGGKRTQEYFKVHFLNNLRLFREENMDKNVFIPDSEVTADIKDFATSIGDVEFNMLGEDLVRDPLL